MFAAFNRYFELEGRSTRREFWSFVLLQFIVYLVLIIALVMTVRGLSFSNEQEMMSAVMADNVGFMIFVALVFWFIATFVPNVTVSVRRLHDRNISGWWYLAYLVASMVPYLGGIAGLVFLVVMLLPGNADDNRFGQNPRGSGWGGSAYAASAY